jgi:hypothetical protein
MINTLISFVENLIENNKNVLEVVHEFAPDDLPWVRNAAEHGLYFLDIAQEWLEKNQFAF